MKEQLEKLVLREDSQTHSLITVGAANVTIKPKRLTAFQFTRRYAANQG